VYQEQIIQMSQTFAGYSASEADILRRAVGKKKRYIIEEQKSVFIEKASELGRDPL
jgi:DNA polymerase-3 subunit alpha